MSSFIKKDFQCPSGFHESGLFPDQVFVGDLDDSLELILIKAPINFDVEKLNGREINLNGRTEVQSSEGKKVVIDSASTSKQLENICFLKKVDEGNCAPVGLRLKRQMDIFESYTFPTAVIPDFQEKRVPFPTALKDRFTPYGSDEPVVFHKCKKKRKTKESNEHKPAKDRQTPGSAETTTLKAEYGDVNHEVQGSEDDNSYNVSPRKKKKKRKKADLNTPSFSVKEYNVERCEISEGEHLENESDSRKKEKKSKKSVDKLYTSFKSETIETDDDENEYKLKEGIYHLKSSSQKEIPSVRHVKKEKISPLKRIKQECKSDASDEY